MRMLMPPQLFVPATQDNGLEDFLGRMAKKESGGNYGALGPVINNGGMYQGDRAVGKYQVMGKNVPSWTKQYLGKAMTAEQFRSDQSAQDTLMRARANELYKKYGNWEDVASVHFTGQPLSKAKGKKDQLGTTTESYVASVAGKPNLFVDTIKGLPKAAGQVAQAVGDFIRPAQKTADIEASHMQNLLPEAIMREKKNQAMESGSIALNSDPMSFYNDEEKYVGVPTGAMKKLVGGAVQKLGAELFHATSKEAADKISKEGFKIMPTANGKRDFGDFLYFATKKNPSSQSLSKYGDTVVKANLSHDSKVMELNGKSIDDESWIIRKILGPMQRTGKFPEGYDAITIKGGQWDGLAIVKDPSSIISPSGASSKAAPGESIKYSSFGDTVQIPGRIKQNNESIISLKNILKTVSRKDSDVREEIQEEIDDLESWNEKAQEFYKKQSGRATIRATVAGAAATGATAALFTPSTVSYDGSKENFAEPMPVSTPQQSVSQKPVIVSEKKDLYGTVSTTSNGTQIRSVPAKYKSMIEDAYKEYPDIIKGMLEGTLMQESSMGTNRHSYNPDIGEFAWLTGFTKVAKQELIRNGIVPDLNTPSGVIKATAAYYSIKQHIKDEAGQVLSTFTDPVELYVERYNGGKLKEDTIAKIQEMFAFYGNPS